MSKYLDMLPKTCKNQEEGIIRAIVIEDMLKHGTIFSEMELKTDGKINCFLKDSIEDILEALYRNKCSVVIWNKGLESNAALFNFNYDNQKAIMVFPITTPEFGQTFLENVIYAKAGNDMAKICPINGDYVLYLDCKECEKRTECEDR